MSGRDIDPRMARLAVALAFVGGYVDAVGFIALAHVFTGHITGNTVLLAIDVAEGTLSHGLHRLLAIVMFIAGMVIGALLNAQLVRREMGSRFALAFALEAVLLMPLILSGGVFPHAATQVARPGWMLYVLVGFAATALGLQNGTFRKVGHATVHTTYITGIVTTLMEGVFAHWFQPRERRPRRSAARAAARPMASEDTAGRAKLVMLAGIASGFAVGAVAGAALYVWRELESLLIPFVLLLAMAAADARRPFAGTE